MRLNITSAAGVVALLEEPEVQVKDFALKKLDHIVDSFWPEISESVGKIEMLYEDEKFPHRKQAALLASKVYYHLGAFEEAVTFALGADDLFNVSVSTEYVETLITKCIDQYTKLRRFNYENASELKPIDAKLEGIVNRMFEKCLSDGRYKQAIGIAFETYRIDIFEKAVQLSSETKEILMFSLKVAMSLIQNRQFRNTILRKLVELYMTLNIPAYINVCQCLIFLDDPQAVSDILEKLLASNNENLLMAYQICFDIYESGTQQFVQQVYSALKPQTASDKIVSETTNDATISNVSTVADEKKVDDPDSLLKRENLLLILTGEKTIELNLQFLIKNNHSDLLILKNTKESIRNSICHNATVVANSLMHFGTTSDQFLRDNLDWLSRATNWAKFSATASLGVIHNGHEKDAMQLMSAYLPKDTDSSSSVYSDGGGLYAMGLIHANHGSGIVDYLLQHLNNTSSDVIKHGACLGLGLAAMGTARQDIYDQLKSALFQDDAVIGEAAGIAMGLIMLQTANASVIEDMISYATETQHEKIVRGLAVGIAMVMYGRLEEADSTIETLIMNKDPILRWSAMYMIGLAYAGSGSNEAIEKLLHVAVSDVSDDVRRIAVTSIGFILFRSADHCPSVVSLLSESYNPHVRFGAAQALGIACAGTGLKEALNLLEPLTNDPVNFVRQGALIASSLVLIQQNEVTCSKSTTFRQLYSKVIGDKHEDVMAKFGAILAQGIIEAGGRNVTIALQSRSGHMSAQAVVGLLIFQQYWYWYPLVHCLSLAFQPTALICLNSKLDMPKLQFKSAAKPSTFAYPAMLEDKKSKKSEKVETVVLSITAKQKKKDDKKKTEEKMDVDDADSVASTSAKDDKDKEKEVKEKEIKKVEPNFEIIENPARVMRTQRSVVSLPVGSKYVPLKNISVGGIIMMKNKREDEPEDIVERVSTGGPQKENDEEEPSPPEPFEWNED